MALSDTNVGSRIRAYRKKRRLSLTELSSRTGIAASNLSSIELGKTTPTLSTLIKIAAAFNMRAGQFLEEACYKRAVLCPKDQGKERPTHFPGVTAQALTDEVSFNRLHAEIIRIEVGGSYLDAGGTDRFFHCLDGRLSATVGDEAYTMRSGDSLYVLGDASLNLQNFATGETSVLVVGLNREAR
jgi:transcriptional regulator with XRE-family HTH domain